MEILFGTLQFNIADGRIFLTSFGGAEKNTAKKSGEAEAKKFMPLSEIQLAGGNNREVYSSSFAGSSESEALRYISQKFDEDSLVIIEKSERLEVETRFIRYADTNAIAAIKSIKNISDNVLKIEKAATLVLKGVGGSIFNADRTYFYKFVQSHHSECQPRRISLFDYGFFPSYARDFKKLSFANVGLWSTKEGLPQGIIENGGTGDFLMFQIESNHNWYYEISTCGEDFYLALSGNSSPAHRYVKVLRPDETHCVARAAFCYGKCLNEVIGQMTVYRRKIACKSVADEGLPVIFNEYMHLSWDSPCEDKTKRYAEAARKAGADYYVIDCGWHDDVPDGVWVYPYMGVWKESVKNFPHGIRKTTDYIRKLGMKSGLWIEPETVGIKCREMTDYYGDDCFLKRNGERLCVFDKYILDFRKPKVRDYLTETVGRMVEDYGADYVKMDYNVDCGFADGDVEEERNAYLTWIDDIHAEFPKILFETCSSGGMRMDYETLKHFSIVSTSDQTDDRLYPYIVGNVLSSVLPEQAAVWSYPVSGIAGMQDKKKAAGEITLEKVVLNMVNSMLGRLHLSSDLTLLDKERFALVKEGVEYIKKLNTVKRFGKPFFPLGFTDFSRDTVSCGLKTDNKIYLAVWVLRGNEKAVVKIQGAKGANVAYPCGLKTEFELKDETLTVNFEESNSARFFEITI